MSSLGESTATDRRLLPARETRPVITRPEVVEAMADPAKRAREHTAPDQNRQERPGKALRPEVTPAASQDVHAGSAEAMRRARELRTRAAAAADDVAATAAQLARLNEAIAGHTQATGHNDEETRDNG